MTPRRLDPDVVGRRLRLAAAAGAIDRDVADRLAPAAGLRNLLVHRYADLDVDLVATAVDEVLDGFAEYVAEVAAFLRSRVVGERPTDAAG